MKRSRPVVARLKRQVPKYCAPEIMDAEDPLFILYTSGTTGKPKGIVHTTGGYLTGAATDHEIHVRSARGRCVLVHRRHWLGHGTFVSRVRPARQWHNVHDVRRRARLARERSFLANLRTLRCHDFLHGADRDSRVHEVGRRHYVQPYDLSQLRLLGSVGEPINPEAWMWYREHIGKNNCPIVDTWWQTETGCIMITPLPGVTATKPGSATVPFPGTHISVLDNDAQEIAVGGGLLAIMRPWPSIARTIWNDDQRYIDTYFSKWPGRPDIYFAGDGVKRDDDGYLWILGRVDDVLNVAGHRIGTMEVESALVDHPSVAEAAVVGKEHELKGQAIAAFVTLRAGFHPSTSLRDELREHVALKIGALARPDDILFSADLPKTRSGKIMRRLLRDIAEGRALGDTTTLADPSVVASLKDQYEAQES